MSAASQYEFLVLLIGLIFALELIARRLNLPPAAAFLLGGIVLALVPGVPVLAIDPDLVMLAFLPPLLMNGAYFTVWREFRSNLLGIVSLALGAVAFTTFVVGVGARLLMPSMPWAVCFALGAIVSPPDAVSAGAILERLKLPGNLSALLQGESLINDASGLVLFRFAVAAALTGAFSMSAALGTFCLLSVGGVAVGLATGYAGLFVIRRLRDSELAITATLLLASASYILGEALHVSGVLSTVTTGLLLGWHQHAVLTAATRIRAHAFWKVLVFLLEAILFILIGLSLRGVLERVGGMRLAAGELAAPVLGVVALVVVSRFAWVFGSYLWLRMAHRVGIARGVPPSLAVATILSWAGMRGVVTLAAALSLPMGFPGRDMVLLCAFAVILVTVLVQGTTLGPLIGWMRLTGAATLRLEQASDAKAWMHMTAAQLNALDTLSRLPDGSHRHPRLVEQFCYRARVAAQYTSERDLHEPVKQAHYLAVLAAIDAGRTESLRMHAQGEIHDRVLRELEHELDLQQMVAESHLK